MRIISLLHCLCSCRDFMKEKYGGIDVLVNNAAIAFKGNATEPMGLQAEVTCKTNYWSTKNACDILFPILRPGAREANSIDLLNFK